MKNLKDSVNAIIYSNRVENGGHPYYLKSESNLSLGDESGLNTLIYEMSQDESNEMMAAIKRVDDSIKEMSPFDQKIDRIGWEREKPKYGMIFNSWISKAGDWLRIQFTDNHLYIIYFQSGQY